MNKLFGNISKRKKQWHKNLHAPFMNTKCGKLNSELCFVVAVTVVVVVNCILFIPLGSQLWKRMEKKDERLSLCPSSFPVPPSHVLSQASCFFTPNKTKNEENFFHLFTFTKKKWESLLSQRKSLLFVSIFFSFENQSIPIKFQFHVITLKVKKFCGFFFIAVYVCVRA